MIQKRKMATKIEESQPQRDISLTEVFQIVRDEFAAYFASIESSRRTCIETMWKKFVSRWRAAESHTAVHGSNSNDPHYEIYQPTSKHTHTIIFLHGRDSTAKEFAPELLESEDSYSRTLSQALPNVRWVFPTAPIINSARFEQNMSQWFDMHTTEDPHYGELEQNPTQAIDIIYHVLAKEAVLVGGFHNIILAGISQGAAVAIHALLKQQHTLGAFLGLNTWLPNPPAIAHAGKKWPEAVKTPVMLAHTRDDPVINVKHGEELKAHLRALDMDVEWHDYWTNDAKTAHWIHEPEGVDDIVAFVESICQGSYAMT